jgi:hypothetical protein
MAAIDDALAEMRSNPEDFLRHYQVQIAGGTPAIVPQRHSDFVIAQAPDETYSGFQTGLSGKLGQTKERPRLRISMANPNQVAGQGEAIFQAYYIGMSEMGGGALAHQVLLPGTGGPDIAVTSQLSGCSFGVGSANSAGDRFVSHIQPPAGQPTAATYQTMRTEATFNAMDAIFERPSRPGNDDYGNAANRATIIGIRENGNWRFYAQIYNMGDRNLFKVEALNE